jgi:DNA-binding transcriptional MerR regulator
VSKAKNNITQELPPIPNKRFFPIRQAAELCGVKPHVLRYWEMEFPKLKPDKRNGGRRYYKQKHIELIRYIRELLYQKGYTIAGAKQQLKNIGTKHSKPEIIDTIAVQTEQVLSQVEQQSLQPILSQIITDLESLVSSAEA